MAMTTDTWTKGDIEFSLRRDEHHDPGVAFGAAVFTETRCNALGWVRRIRLERWSDGLWRAMGQQEGCENPHDALERVVQ